MTERISLEFGVQAFNIFNHIQLGDPALTTWLSITRRRWTAQGTRCPITGYFTGRKFRSDHLDQRISTTTTTMRRRRTPAPVCPADSIHGSRSSSNSSASLCETQVRLQVRDQVFSEISGVA